MRAAQPEPYHLLVNPISLSFRAGRSWLSGQAHDLGNTEILDVLDIVIDGVNATADLRESSLEGVMEELGEASILLAEGEETAVVTFGLPRAELVLFRSGPNVRLSLVVQDPAQSLRLDDLEVDGGLFFGAVASALETFISDLERSGLRRPQSLVERLELLESRLSRFSSEGLPAASVPADGLGAARSIRRWRPSPSRAMRCDFELFETIGHQPASGRGADLYSLLRGGKVSLFDSEDTELASWVGPPFLTFRDFCRQARDLLSTWDDSDEIVLRLGGAVFRPAAAGCKSSGEPASALLDAIVMVLFATLDYCALQKTGYERSGGNAYVDDLDEEAKRLLSRFLDLFEGDRPGPPPLPSAAARGAAPQTISRRPLTPWRLRKVNITHSWSYDAGPLVQGGFGLLGKGLLAAGEFGLQSLDLGDGRPDWSREDVEAVWLGPGRGMPILVSTQLGLEMVTPTGATAWLTEALEAAPGLGQAYLRGPGRLVFSPDGRSAVAHAEYDGHTSWRFVPPCHGRCRVTGGPAGILLATDEGFLYAIDADTGRLRWRLETRLQSSHLHLSASGRVLVLGVGPRGPARFMADAATGESADLSSLPADEIGAPIPSGPRLLTPAVIDGRGAVFVLEDDGEAKKIDVEEIEGIPGLLPDRNRIVAVDQSGSVVSMGLGGRRAWRSGIASGSQTPVMAAARGIYLLANSEGLYVLDMDDGSLLGSSPLVPAVEVSKMAVGRELDLYIADPEGTILAMKVGPRLAVVG